MSAIPSICKVLQTFSVSLNKSLSYTINSDAEMLSLVFWNVFVLNGDRSALQLDYMAKEIWEPFEKIVERNFKAYLKATFILPSNKSSTPFEPETPRGCSTETPKEGYMDQILTRFPFELMSMLQKYLHDHLMFTALDVDVLDKFASNYWIMNALSAYYILRMQFAINSLDEVYELGSTENLTQKSEVLINTFSSLNYSFFKEDTCLLNIHTMAQLKVILLCKDYFRSVVEIREESYKPTLIKVLTNTHSHKCFIMAYDIWRAFSPQDTPKYAFAYIIDTAKKCISIALESNKEGVIALSGIVNTIIKFQDHKEERKVIVRQCTINKNTLNASKIESIINIKLDPGKAIEITSTHDTPYTLLKFKAKNCLTIDETATQERLAEMYSKLLN